jgi:hypothetical protein
MNLYPIRFRFSTVKFCLLFLVPLVAGQFMLKLHDARTPFYLGDQDPAYMYWGGIVHLVTEGRTEFIDNPGLTVQWIGAVYVQISRLLSGLAEEAFLSSLVVSAEDYLGQLSLVFLWINIIVCLLIGFVVLNRVGRMIPAVLCQVGFFAASKFMLYRMVGVASEPLLISSLGLIFCALVIFVTEPAEEQTKAKWGWIFAVAGSFMLLTKFTALPVLAVFFMALPLWKQRLQFVVGLFALCNLVLVGSAQQNSLYFYEFLFKIFTRSGSYGGGGVPQSLADYGVNIFQIWRSDPFLLFVWAALLVSLIKDSLFSGSELLQVFSKRMEDRLSLGLFIAISGHLMIAGKQFRQHYLLTGVVLGVLSLLLLYLFAKDKHSRCLLIGLATCATGLFVFNVFGARSVLNDTRYFKAENRKVEAYISENLGDHSMIAYKSTISEASAWHYFRVYSKIDSLEDIIDKQLGGSKWVNSKAELARHSLENGSLILIAPNRLPSPFPKAELVFQSDFDAVYKVNGQ